MSQKNNKFHEYWYNKYLKNNQKMCKTEIQFNLVYNNYKGGK
jgi:hypothetical protein